MRRQRLERQTTQGGPRVVWNRYSSLESPCKMNKLCDGGDSVVHRYDGDTGHSPLYNGRVLAELPDMDRQKKRRWRRRCEKVLLVADAGRPPGSTQQGTGTARNRLSPRWNGLTQTQAAEARVRIPRSANLRHRPSKTMFVLAARKSDGGFAEIRPILFSIYRQQFRAELLKLRAGRSGGIELVLHHGDASH